MKGAIVMMAASQVSERAVRQIPEEQAFEIFESASQYFLGIPAVQFLKDWKSGKLSSSDDPGIFEVASLIPPSLR